MPEKDYEEPFSNPIAPFGSDHLHADGLHQRLTNDDFRKLLMTPRVPAATGPSATVASQRAELKKKEILGESKAEKRKKKKLFYAKLKKEEEDQLAELSKKYRDRAQERREGINPDYQNDDPMITAGGYRAVAPDAKSGLDAAERRRQMIQESKFLGGDMEHTHLVKGLDYALLQKVRSEIQSKEKEEEEQLERITKENKKTEEEEEEELQFKTRLGRNIYRLLLRNDIPEKNDLFLPGRMAYVVDLEEEYAESDIPTTLVRSKADIPHVEYMATLTTNDIVINKLTQILSYLRQGARHNKKTRRKEKDRTDEEERQLRSSVEDSIYGDIGNYIPSIKTERNAQNKNTERHQYFEQPTNDLKEEERIKIERDLAELGTNIPPASTLASLKAEREERSNRQQQLLSKLASEPQGYAECYPGFEEMHDAIEDSDDEVDYSKMDMGNKKGPIGRWDFDTQEEYSDYMNQKEALPKAAFQYGVKMADGRRTRRIPKERNEKAVLDREWQKIKNILDKRKSLGVASGEPDYKMPKY